MSTLEGAVGHVCGLRDSLAEILGKLEGWNRRLTNHDPPRLHFSDIFPGPQNASKIRSDLPREVATGLKLGQ